MFAFLKISEQKIFYKISNLKFENRILSFQKIKMNKFTIIIKTNLKFDSGDLKLYIN